VSEGSTDLLFRNYDLEINSTTLKLVGNLYMLKMYLHIENEAASLRHSKLRAGIGKNTKICRKVIGQNVKSSKLLRALF